MAYALQSLLKIREMREDRASADLTAAKQAVREAERALERRRQELQKFEETCEERRDSIYNAVLGRSVSREDLDLVLEAVGRIDEEGALKADNVKMAMGEVQKKEEKAKECQVVFTEASKNRMKISEHKKIWIAADSAEQERKLESELEDFTGKKNVEESQNDGN
ncbi:MAG: type III secretion protein [Lentisphaeria bacterium]|nr:type III secretion protein [Lentisphaeria bacterium]